MLVMAILLVATALALPSIQPMVTTNDLQAASDALQSRWTEMRTRAISDGIAYRFAIKEKTGCYKIAPNTKEYWGGDADDSSVPPDVQPLVIEDTLPGKVLFQKFDVTCCNDCPAGSQAGSSGGWSHVLTFLPNGTARENVTVTFGQDGARSSTLVVRGMTGTVTTVDDEALAKETRP
jgi:type II secretory pathway pseudopilin PulG